MVPAVVPGVEQHQARWACVARDVQWLHHDVVLRDAHVLQRVVPVHVRLQIRAAALNKPLRFFTELRLQWQHGVSNSRAVRTRVRVYITHDTFLLVRQYNGYCLQ